MKRTLCGLALLMAIGCSETPTAPTSTTSMTTSTTTAAGPAVIQLNWNITAASCGQVGVPPVQPSFADAKITQQHDGSVIASWPYASSTRTGTLYARFVNENNTWALCSWDVADI